MSNRRLLAIHSNFTSDVKFNLGFKIGQEKKLHVRLIECKMNRIIHGILASEGKGQKNRKEMEWPYGWIQRFVCRKWMKPDRDSMKCIWTLVGSFVLERVVHMNDWKCGMRQGHLGYDWSWKVEMWPKQMGMCREARLHDKEFFRDWTIGPCMMAHHVQQYITVYMYIYLSKRAGNKTQAS